MKYLTNLRLRLEKEKFTSFLSVKSLQILQEQAQPKLSKANSFIDDHEEIYFPFTRIFISIPCKDGTHTSIKFRSHCYKWSGKKMVAHKTWCFLGKSCLQLSLYKNIQMCLMNSWYSLKYIWIFILHSKKGNFFVMALGNLQDDIVLN